MKVGFIAILGRPNVGKSTLLNALLSKKVSVVSPRAQTTRDAISGILNEKDKQIVFVDTPGIFRGEAGLDRYMNKAAFDSSKDVNAILYLIDASAPSLDTDIRILSSFKEKAPTFLILNKIDLIRAEAGMKLKDQLSEAFPNCKIIETCLLENYGIREIKDAIDPLLEEGLPFYPDDMLTDKDHAYQTKEVIRQELLHFLKQEVPHQAAVEVKKLEKKDGAYQIEATIVVDKENHKGIVIGKGGSMIKKISMSARHELERMWHEHISSLSIDVDAEPGWRSNPKRLKELGYGG